MTRGQVRLLKILKPFEKFNFLWVAVVFVSIAALLTIAEARMGAMGVVKQQMQLFFGFG